MSSKILNILKTMLLFMCVGTGIQIPLQPLMARWSIAATVARFIAILLPSIVAELKQHGGFDKSFGLDLCIDVFGAIGAQQLLASLPLPTINALSNTMALATAGLFSVIYNFGDDQ